MVVDSLKALDLKRPIREAEVGRAAEFAASVDNDLNATWSGRSRNRNSQGSSAAPKSTPRVCPTKSARVAADALRRALGLPERTRPIIGERAQVRAWGLLWELEGESLLRSRQLATTGTADCPVTTG